MELILDASSRATRAGLGLDGGLRWACEPLAPQEHTRLLLPAVMSGLEALQASFADIKLVVVALGPGPFNGLRVAVSAAKGLAAGIGAPVVGIPTLHAEAWRCLPSEAMVRPVVSAGRSNYTTALFRWSSSTWVQIEDSEHVDLLALARALDTNERTSLCGELQEFLDTPLFVGLMNLRVAAVTGSRLDALAMLGWHSYLSGDTIAPASLQPLYVHPPHITAPRHRRP